METPAQIYGMAQKEATLTLFESRTVQTVTIRVLKRSEASVSSIGVRRLTANVGSSLTPTAAPSRRLVFLGDSFTCGFGNEGTPEQPFQTRTENGCDTYAARRPAPWVRIYSASAGRVSAYAPPTPRRRSPTPPF